MQQGGGTPAQSQYGVPSTEVTPPATAALNMHMMLPAAAVTDHSQQQQLVEEASPISSRPPAPPGNLDEFMRLSGLPDEDTLDADRSGGGVASGNRWPRQETLALLQIRSEMDAAFRDASVKGPLWEDVSRKLVELGYKRSAKKCKEKFENVHKYYKRTKEGRGGRQDGKSYRFFTQLEALHNNTTNNAATITTSATTTTTATLDVAPVSVGIPMSVSSGRIPASTIGMPSSSPIFPPNLTAVSAPSTLAAAGVSFSSTSNSFTSSPSCEEDDNEDDEDEPSNTASGGSRKRKHHSTSSKGGGTRTRRKMEFFGGLMKHVMQKQEAMQQRFLEAIEKREHERMIREEAWKRQEMARLSREHELMAQERAISASRDAAIVSFLQKVTGQTIQLPSPPITIPAVPQPQPVQLAPVVTVSIQHPPPTQTQPAPPQQLDKDHHQQQQQQQQNISSDVVIGVPPEQEVGGSSGSLEPSSSRWPKAEVLALIKLRSGLESRYQEAGPKGPLWEEISLGMQRMGYKRSAKRCKEKWENINKYFKKVKERNKKRPEDAKTCPYFHELDALYRKKILGSTSGSGFANQIRSEEQQRQEEIMKSDPLLIPPSNPGDHWNEVSAKMPAQLSRSPSKTGSDADPNVGLPGSLFGEGNEGAPDKPEGIVKESLKLPGMQKEQHRQQQQQQFVVHDYDKMEEVDDSDNVYDEDDESDIEDDDDEYDEQLEAKRKMAYKIEFQRQNTSASNGGGNGAPSFLAMVQ